MRQKELINNSRQDQEQVTLGCTMKVTSPLSLPSLAQHVTLCCPYAPTAPSTCSHLFKLLQTLWRLMAMYLNPPTPLFAFQATSRATCTD